MHRIFPHGRSLSRTVNAPIVWQRTFPEMLDTVLIRWWRSISLLTAKKSRRFLKCSYLGSREIIQVPIRMRIYQGAKRNLTSSYWDEHLSERKINQVFWNSSKRQAADTGSNFIVKLLMAAQNWLGGFKQLRLTAPRQNHIWSFNLERLLLPSLNLLWISALPVDMFWYTEWRTIKSKWRHWFFIDVSHEKYY